MVIWSKRETLTKQIYLQINVKLVMLCLLYLRSFSYRAVIECRISKLHSMLSIRYKSDVTLIFGEILKLKGNRVKRAQIPETINYEPPFQGLNTNNLFEILILLQKKSLELGYGQYQAQASNLP